MKLCKCSNGHYYDGDIYQNCPHCESSSQVPKMGNMRNDDIIQCPKGHSYDRTRYTSCPECEKLEAEKKPGKGKTVSLFSVQNYVDQEKERKGEKVEQGAVRTTITENFYSNIGSAGEEKHSLDMEIEKLNRTVRLMPQDNSDSYARQDAFPEYVSANERIEANSMPRRDALPSDEGKTVSLATSQAGAVKEPLVGWLVGLNGEVYGEGFPLYAGRNFVGRSNSMDVVLRGDMSVSREKHAVIIYDPMGRKFLIQPGDSTKSLLYMNNELVIDTKEMNHGSEILIGNTRLKFVAFCNEDFSWDMQS